VLANGQAQQAEGPKATESATENKPPMTQRKRRTGKGEPVV